MSGQADGRGAGMRQGEPRVASGKAGPTRAEKPAKSAVATPAEAASAPHAANTDVAGIAIWASVSEAVDAAIREQIKAGVFPIRLKPEEWTSGDNNWLLDVIAPDARSTAAVIANVRS